MTSFIKPEVHNVQKKEGFKPGMKERGSDGIRIVISINVSSIATVYLLSQLRRRHRVCGHDTIAILWV